MDDLISRQAAIEAILHNQELYSNNFGDDPIDKYTVAIIDNDAQTIAQLPSTQLDIVACGDCMHWICHDRRCGYWNHGVKPLDWCCHAERRTDG